MNRWLKGLLTIVGAVFFSTLGIFASDGLQGIDSRISNIAGIKGAGICERGAILVQGQKGALCVDIYEASPSEECPFPQPLNVTESEQNANTKDCTARSEDGVKPWSYVALPQAQRICAASGKRLPTSEEWYRLALGTNPNTCVVADSSTAVTGTDACVSSSGAHDMVGNVWEWIDATVQGNTFDGRALPQTGYVTSVDASGIAITSGEGADDMYGKDYFWSKEDGVFGMIRGGFYGSKEDAGLYTVNASVLTSFASQGVGFRCVKDVM